MKIKLFLLCLLFVSVPVTAQITVVRVQNNQIYLDTSALKTPIQVGDNFKVILSSEKLTNPKTGRELGLIHNYSSQGVITEVQPLYAVGKLPSEAGVEVGQEAVLETVITPQITVAKLPSKPAEKLSSKHLKNTYDPVEQEIVSLSSADITAPGANNLITLSDKGLVTVWERNNESLKQLLSYKLPTGKTPLTLSAVALRGRPTAELFITSYDTALARISTLILAYENDHWQELGTVPYFVKEIGCGTEKTLWMQRPFSNGTRPGSAHNLVYQDGKFTAGLQEWNIQHTWLPGSNQFPAGPEGELYTIYTTSAGRIKMNLPNGKTTQYKDFSVGSPNRVKYKQEIVKFFPSLQVVQSQGIAQAVAVENTAKFGILSSTFGQYESGKIHFLTYEKGRLTAKNTEELDGFVYDTACSDTAILVAEVLPDGRSSVVEILK